MSSSRDAKPATCGASSASVHAEPLAVPVLERDARRDGPGRDAARWSGWSGSRCSFSLADVPTTPRLRRRHFFLSPRLLGDGASVGCLGALVGALLLDGLRTSWSCLAVATCRSSWLPHWRSLNWLRAGHTLRRPGSVPDVDDAQLAAVLVAGGRRPGRSRCSRRRARGRDEDARSPTSSRRPTRRPRLRSWRRLRRERPGGLDRGGGGRGPRGNEWPHLGDRPGRRHLQLPPRPRLVVQRACPGRRRRPRARRGASPVHGHDVRRRAGAGEHGRRAAAGQAGRPPAARVVRHDVPPSAVLRGRDRRCLQACGLAASRRCG